MPVSDVNRPLWALLDSQSEDSKADGDYLTDRQGDPVPSLGERIDAFLKAVHGADRTFTPGERQRAKDIFLDSMVDSILVRSQRHNTKEMPNSVFRLLIDGSPLTPEEQGSWFDDPKLRQDLHLLKRQLKYSSRNLDLKMPQAIAAASEEELNDRFFGGGSVRIRESSNRGQIFIVLRFEDPAVLMEPPKALLVEGPEHEIVRSDLPKPDGEGQIILIKDLSNESDALLINLLRNPFSVGTFLA